MTRKKGGGRESGEVGPQRPQQGHDAAANPAAPDGYQHGNEGTAAAHAPESMGCTATNDHERIRELEAEMACAYQQLDEEREGREAVEDAERACKAANESQRRTIAELEAELANAYEALRDDWQPFKDRAERAEAAFQAEHEVQERGAKALQALMALNYENIARAERAEARMKEGWCGKCDTEQGNLVDLLEASIEEYLGTATELYDRAERAEARVAELLARVYELRGEDRG